MKYIIISLFIFWISGASLLYAQENVAGEITWVEGTVKIEYPQKGAEDAKIGAKIFANATVITGESSRIVIRFLDGTILSIAPKTKIQIESFVVNNEKREASIMTYIGRVRAVVKKFLGGKSKFEFKSKTAIAGVRGTHLALDVLDDGTTRVYLMSGFLGVYNKDKMDLPEIMLSEGTYSEVKEGQAPTPPMPIPPDLLQDIYKSTSILAMIRNELRDSLTKGTKLNPELNIPLSDYEEKLVSELKTKEKEEAVIKAFSDSLTQPLREQDVQGVVMPSDYIGEKNERRLDVNVIIDTGNY